MIKKSKIIEPKPIFRGRIEKSSSTIYFPNPEKAEEWHKKDPSQRHLSSSFKAGDIQAIPTITVKKATEDDLEDLPEWESY